MAEYNEIDMMKVENERDFYKSLTESIIGDMFELFMFRGCEFYIPKNQSEDVINETKEWLAAYEEAEKTMNEMAGMLVERFKDIAIKKPM